jgi:hypothetical protein
MTASQHNERRYRLYLNSKLIIDELTNSSNFISTCADLRLSPRLYPVRLNARPAREGNAGETLAPRHGNPWRGVKLTGRQFSSLARAGSTLRAY